MTQLLERAYAEVAQLPTADQDAIAALILDEIESERGWDHLFAASPDLLARLAAEALAEHQAGETQPLDPDAL